MINSFFLSKTTAHHFARCLKIFCYIVFFIGVFASVLILLGRVEVNLAMPEKYFENALLFEKDRAATSRFFFATPFDHLHLSVHDKVGFATWLCIALMGLVKILPFTVCSYFMAGFFKNISLDKVFVFSNANILLYNGIILSVSSILHPILNAFLFPSILTLFSKNRISVSTQPDLMGIFMGITLLIAAYVFHYGIYLQDEADHTL